MVGYMSIEEQVDADFARARRKATLRRLAARLRRKSTSARLSCFEEVRRKLGAAGGLYRGRSAVRLSNIVRKRRTVLRIRRGLPARQQESEDEVGADRPSIPPRRGTTPGQPVQDRRLLLRPRREPPHQRRPFPRGRVDRRRGDGVPRPVANPYKIGGSYFAADGGSWPDAASPRRRKRRKPVEGGLGRPRQFT